MKEREWGGGGGGGGGGEGRRERLRKRERTEGEKRTHSPYSISICMKHTERQFLFSVHTHICNAITQHAK